MTMPRPKLKLVPATKSPGNARADNLYFQFKMSCVRPEMTDADLIRLSDGNGRMLTSLRGHHARLRDANIDNFCRRWDEWHALYQQWRQTQDNEIWEQQERAHRRLLLAIDRLP
jgi:hypothetical protein